MGLGLRAPPGGAGSYLGPGSDPIPQCDEHRRIYPALGVYYHTAIRLKQRGAHNLEVVLAEPVPVRLNQPYGIVQGAKNRHAALLFLEYICSAEGQQLIDEIEPVKSSIYFPGAKVEQLLRGRKLSVAGWDDFDRMGAYTEEIFHAFGMPQGKK